MRKIFASIFRFIARFLAVLFAIVFVVATVLVLLLWNLDHTLLRAETYKRALVENHVYEQLPILVSEQLASFDTFFADPCVENPLVCAIDGASSELQTCLTDALGEKAYAEIGSWRRNPTEAEMQRSQNCLDQFAESTPQTGDENPLLNASAEVQACVKQSLGDQVYQTLNTGQRPPTKPETRRINTCIRKIRNASESKYSLRDDSLTLLKDLSPEQWQKLIVLLLPADDLQQMTEPALDQVFSYLKGETHSAKISLVNLKARLSGQAGQELVLLILDSQPPCTEEQKAQIDAGNFENGGQQAIYCAATGETLAKMLPGMQDRLAKVISTIPDEARLIKPASASAQSASEGPLGNNPVSALRKIHRWLRFSPLLPLSPLLLVTLFGVRSRRGWLRWWGIPLLVAGLIALSIGIAAQPVLDWAWVNYAADQLPSMISANLGELSHDVARSVVDEVTKWVMLEAGLIALLGLAAIIISYRMGPKRKVLKETAHAFTPPEIALVEEENKLVRPRYEDESGYS